MDKKKPRKYRYAIDLSLDERAGARKRATHLGLDMATYLRQLLRRDCGLPALGTDSEVAA